MASRNDRLLKAGARVAGEFLVVPGTALLMDGQVKRGMLHLGTGVLAAMALGPLGVLLVNANSLSLSVAGKNLLEALVGDDDPRALKLTEVVKSGIERGLTVDEIRESLLEDVEDLYAEASIAPSASKS
jgi:hypothetical protein